MASGFNGERGRELDTFHTWRLDVSAAGAADGSGGGDANASFTLQSLVFKNNQSLSEHTYWGVQAGSPDVGDGGQCVPAVTQQRGQHRPAL